MLCNHEFRAESGCLVHETDGNLRAVVPPEGFADFVKAWPDAAPIVAQLTGGTVAAVTVAAPPAPQPAFLPAPKPCAALA